MSYQKKNNKYITKKATTNFQIVSALHKSKQKIITKRTKNQTSYYQYEF